MVNFFVSLTLGLSCLQASMTAPQVYPELISGPGLPSLAELGLTVADLVAIGLPKVETIAGALGQVAMCGEFDYSYADVNDLIVCLNYLNSVGGNRCGATTLCQHGSARVDGHGADHWDTRTTVSWQVQASWPTTPFPDRPLTQSAEHSGSAANAVLWIINHCTRGDNMCGGNYTSVENSDFIVDALHQF